jgi:hypothetical protein
VYITSDSWNFINNTTASHIQVPLVTALCPVLADSCLSCKTMQIKYKMTKKPYIIGSYTIIMSELLSIVFRCQVAIIHSPVSLGTGEH